MIMELDDREASSFPSGLRRLKNGVPQGSVRALFLFNVYICGPPPITPVKFANADNLAILHSNEELKMLERTLTYDMTTFSA